MFLINSNILYYSYLYNHCKKAATFHATGTYAFITLAIDGIFIIYIMNSNFT